MWSSSEPDAMRMVLRSPVSFLRMYPPLSVPSRLTDAGTSVWFPTFWRVRMSAVGPSFFSTAPAHAAATSSGSPGR